MKRNILLSGMFGITALAAGVACHRLAPGLGLVIMPMFWPLAALSAMVPARYSVTTAVVVPFVAFALSGMPALPVIVAAKFAVFTGAIAYARQLIVKTHNKEK